VGSDNSHAEAFAKLANVPEEGKPRIEEVQVTHIYGTDAARTQEVATLGKIPNIVDDMQEMIGSVDGVAVVWRHGGLHLQHTLPFLKAGLPVFVDKPLALSEADATQMIDAALAAKVGFTSFSTVRYASSLQEYLQYLHTECGDLLTGMCTGQVQLASEYGGVFFYGIHAVELMHTIFGYGCQSVLARQNNENLQVICTLPNQKLVTLNLVGGGFKVPFHAAAFGSEGWGTHEINPSTMYYNGMKVFLEVMRTGTWPLTPEQLLEPVRILEATVQSIQDRKEVALA
jgi:predicted dehydrogenase